MQITFRGEEKFEIKTKDATTLVTSEGVAIDGFKISGPGEYERKGIFVEGVQPNGDGTVFVLRSESISICYPGILTEAISDEAAKMIGDIDILFVPLGQKGSLDLKKAREFISMIDPRIVIPMLYEDATEFKNLEGVTEEDLETLKIKRADLPENERRVVVLTAK